MGLLDEAIRDHLDLKRRRGADPAEIERAEREAFGSARRDFGDSTGTAQGADVGAIAPDDLYAEPPAEDAELHVAELSPEIDLDVPEHDDDHPPWHEPAVGEDPYAIEPQPPAGPVAEPPPARSGDDSRGEPAAPPTPVPASGSAEPPAAPEPAFGETAEFDVETAFAEETDEHGDPLEETPEFLQDAPEHDRLWFEQRPPRDFDFDS